jgi:hypothetical protein
MSRYWIELAARTLRIVEHRIVRPRQRRGLGIRLENLEARLALSSYSAGSFHADLNPQPLPPGRAIDMVALPPRGHANSNDQG